MPRILGVDIPTNKKIKISLTYLYGVGHKTALDIVESCGIDPDLRASELTDSNISAITRMLEQDFEVEGEFIR